MITIEKSVMPDLLGEQLRHSDVNDKKTLHADSYHSESPLSTKSVSDVGNTGQIQDASKSWRTCRNTTEEDPTEKNRSFSIQSILSSNLIPNTVQSNLIRHENLQENESSRTLHCDDTKTNPHYGSRVEDTMSRLRQIQSESEKLGHLNCAFTRPNDELPLSSLSASRVPPPSMSGFERIDKLSSMGYVDATSDAFLPNASFSRLGPFFPGPLHHLRTPFNMPSMMQRFGNPGFGMTPFRPQFSPASIPLQWLQNEALLRNFSELAGEL